MAGSLPLADSDPEILSLIKEEYDRQFEGLELIASENFTSRAVMECLGSCLTNKYSEGNPNRRYYGGCEIIDKIEILCMNRALAAFHLDEKEWGVNVQPYSGSPANFEVYTALVPPHGRIMGLDLPSGGHLTHGYQTKTKKVSASSIFFESMPYRVCEKTGWIDYDEMEERATLFMPKILVCGGSAYPRDIDYERFRKVADKIGAILMCDMAHYSGLAATGIVKSPFDYCDIVTSTTHKTLRGPRSGLIFFRRGTKRPADPKNMDIVYDFEQKIKDAVFPALQGGPHNHQIAAVATALKEVASPAFSEYAKQVVKNSKALAAYLMERGHKLTTDGTDTHLLLWDLRPFELTGSKLEKVFDMVAISVNKNTVHGDKSAFSPSGIRIGTAALTSRGFREKDFEKVGEFLIRGVEIAVKIQKVSGKKLVDFLKALDGSADIMTMHAEVIEFAKTYYLPGRDAQ